MRSKRHSVYEGRRTTEISFPLGGIGSGCIGLGGNGRFAEWEIFNRPDKHALSGLSHFAIKAEAGGKVLDARVLQGDLPPPYTGVGFGPPRETLAGLPHFRDVTFQGEFPLAQLSFKEPKFPGRVTMTAFNPFIPLNAADSSLPAAFFEIAVTNPTRRAITYTVCLSVKNPLPANTTINRYRREGDRSLIHLGEGQLAPDDPQFGDLTLATDAPQASSQEYWFRGAWFDNLGVYWHDLTQPGPFRNRHYPEPGGNGNDHGLLAAHVTVKPGQTGRARFVIAWNFPNCHNYWSPEKGACAGGCTPPADKPRVWKNYYATVFPDSTRTAAYCLREWDRLAAGTRQFKEVLFASTLPAPVLDAVSANMSILKSPTVLRLEDGSLYGWEGCCDKAGCCEGSCTHVWNYAYALPFLFPELERSIRKLDYTHNLEDDGRMAFRLQLPLGRERSSFRACADGQFGGVIKMYREWKICGDTDWLRGLWPAVKKSIDYAWSPANPDRWDPDQSGVLTGRQHHTLDMELFGPNSWLTGFYLAALKAGAEMAEALGDPETAATYRRIFTRGRAWVEAHLFNGEYYRQQIDLHDRHLVEGYDAGPPTMVGKTLDTYWNAEHGEIKYQIGEGCGIDQVLAQWHANLCGLGAIFDPVRTRRALRSVYRYNFKRSMRDYANFCRLYCLNDEAGTIMFAWPPQKCAPIVPIPYAQETMHGFEYQVASHMIQEGMVNEGVELVKAVRDRYDGERRNPWNEIECGSNYARSMASYALLNAFSGFAFDSVRRAIGFRPAVPRRPFRCFWALNTAWGDVTVGRTRVDIRVLYGELAVDTLDVPLSKGRSVATLGGHPLAFTREGGQLRLAATAVVREGQSLTVTQAAARR